MRSQISVVLVLSLMLGSVALSQDPAANLPTDAAIEIESLRAELETLRQQMARRSVEADDLLAPPVDPERFNRDSVVEPGDFRGAILLPGTDVSLRIDGYARFDAIYDTGFVGSGIRLFPATIALDQTPLAQRRGKTTLSGAQSRLSFDAQAKTEIGKMRGFVELDFLENDIDPRIRHVFGEWNLGKTDIIGGQTWSTFMGPGSLPQLVPITAGAGSVFRRPPQLRVTRNLMQGLACAIALEDPASFDFTLPDPVNDRFLQRWPDFVARIRVVTANASTLQVASLVRGIGFENSVGQERLRTGWGLSSTAKLEINECNDIRMGVAGGRGIGSYLTGLAGDLSAAAPEVDGFRTLEAIGAFGAFHHRWTKRWQSNLYYGYSDVESTPFMPLTAGDAVHNGGINLIWSPRPGFGIGLEYDYGERQVRDGTSGDNHRVQFAFQFGP